MWCKQCKREKPESEFLSLRKGRGWRVTKCNPCASANMAKYGAKSWVGRKADEVVEATE